MRSAGEHISDYRKKRGTNHKPWKLKEPKETEQNIKIRVHKAEHDRDRTLILAPQIVVQPRQEWVVVEDVSRWSGVLCLLIFSIYIFSSLFHEAKTVFMK